MGLALLLLPALLAFMIGFFVCAKLKSGSL